MKNNSFSINLFLIGALSLVFSACGNQELMTDDFEEITGEARISITVNTPVDGGIVVKGGRTRSTVEDETDEATVNSLNVFLFEKGGGDADTDYTYYKTYSFGHGEANGELGDGSNGAKTCTIDIEKEMMGKTVRIALTANDKTSLNGSLQAGTTTLEDFKKALATATVVDGDKADALVGGETDKSFPMSSIVKDAHQLTPLGADVEATLVRNVSRLDIFNYTPNLTITGVSVANVNNKSHLFGVDGNVSVPAEAARISLAPLKEFSDKTSAGLSFKQPASGTDESDYRRENTHRMYYLYEQLVTDEASSPVVTIEYTLKVGAADQPGRVTVKFKNSKEPSGFVNVSRNTLYRIRLGDGKNVSTGIVQAAFEVADWTEGGNIDTGLNPGDESVGKDYADAAIGDIMLSDGKLISKDATLTGNEKKKAIGIVAYIGADRIGTEAKTALSNKGVTVPHGLILALKNAAAAIC